MSCFEGQKGLEKGKKYSRIRLDKNVGYTSSIQDSCRELKEPNNEF